MDELYRQTARQQVSTQKGYRIGFSIPLGVSAYLCDPLSQETPISFLFLATLERMLWVGVGWAHPWSSVLTRCKEEYGILGLSGIENGRKREKSYLFGFCFSFWLCPSRRQHLGRFVAEEEM